MSTDEKEAALGIACIMGGLFIFALSLPWVIQLAFIYSDWVKGFFGS